MHIEWRGVAAGLFALYSTSSLAAPADLHSGRYFCVEELGGGLRFDETLKKWSAARFTANGKFVLKLDRQDDFVTDAPNKERMQSYKVSITPNGRKIAAQCVSSGLSFVIVDRDSVIRCRSSLWDYAFNVRTGRYLGAYMQGYINGSDSNDDTPAITGGTCTKID